MALNLAGGYCFSCVLPLSSGKHRVRIEKAFHTFSGRWGHSVKRHDVQLLFCIIFYLYEQSAITVICQTNSVFFKKNHFFSCFIFSPKELFLVEILKVYVDRIGVCFETYWRSRSKFTLCRQIIKWRRYDKNVSDILGKNFFSAFIQQITLSGW